MPVYRNPGNGPAGPAGKTVLTTSGAPSSGTGTDGDFAYDPTASLMYGPKTSGTWPAGVSLKGATGNTGAAGSNGTNGKTVLTTSGAPGNGTGTDGDYAYDPATYLMYGPKASGAWPAGVSLKGATGAAGAGGGGSSDVVGATLNALVPAPRTGRWYGMPNIGLASTASFNSGLVLVQPFVVPRTPVNPLQSISVRVGTAASGVTIRGALYICDPSHGEPTALHADLGTADASTAGLRPFSSLPATLPANRYALALQPSGTVTLNTATSALAGLVPSLTAPGSTTMASCWTVAGIGSASWPDPVVPTSIGASYIRFDLAF